jgi:hypothetical protein
MAPERVDVQDWALQQSGVSRISSGMVPEKVGVQDWVSRIGFQKEWMSRIGLRFGRAGGPGGGYFVGEPCQSSGPAYA